MAYRDRPEMVSTLYANSGHENAAGLTRSEDTEAIEQLRQMNEYLENIFENSPDAIGIVDRKGKFIRWNSMAAEQYGYTFEDLRGKSAFDMYADKEELEIMLARLRAEGSVKKYEIKFRRKDGAVRVYEISIGLLKNAAGEVTGSVCVSRDPSPLRKAVKELRREIELRHETEGALRASEAVYRESEKKYRNLSQQFNALLDAIPDGMLLVDRDMKIIWANRACASLAGKENDPSTLLGMFCYEQLHSRCLPCANCPVEKVFSTGETSHEEITHSSGATFEVRSVPVKDDHGKVLYVINVIRDTTECRKIERQFRQVQKMEAIGTLAGGIAHDFNNILGIILGYTDLALIGVGDEATVRRGLEQVQKAIYRARELIKQILAFSRCSEQAAEPVSLISIISETLKLLRPAVPSSIEIRKKVESMPQGSDIIMAEATQVHQVLMNLCTNAAHAMREHGGTLVIDLSRRVLSHEDKAHTGLVPGSYACITVSDTGHGMNSDTLERIFEPFFSTKGPGEGTGLGLSVAYGIVKNHKGAITVYSEEGRGTVFRVYFPSSQTAETVEHHLARPLLQGTETILLVDDEAALADIGQKLLERLGYRVFATTSSIEALEVFGRDPDKFDLVITDQTMPKMMGIELSAKLLEIRPDIPIVLVTGFSEVITPEAAKRLGIREFLMKPLLTEDLSYRIRKVLDGN